MLPHILGVIVCQHQHDVLRLPAMTVMGSEQAFAKLVDEELARHLLDGHARFVLYRCSSVRTGRRGDCAGRGCPQDSDDYMLVAPTARSPQHRPWPQCDVDGSEEPAVGVKLVAVSGRLVGLVVGVEEIAVRQDDGGCRKLGLTQPPGPPTRALGWRQSWWS